jgi:hypothetical protein
MIQALYDKLAIPETCHLGKRVFKKLFHENAKLGATDKKALRDDIDTITWVYTLKPTTIPIHVYKDDEREYEEIALLQVDLKTQKRTGRIVEIIHRAIPYPLVLVFVFETSVAISLAHKRFSQAERGAVVAEEFVTTDWIDLGPGSPTPVQQAFLDSLAVTKLPQTHFYAFYSTMMDRLIALDCARLTGEYRIDPGNAAERREARRERLAQCHELEVRIAEARAAAKREKQINRLADLNVELRRLQGRLAEMVSGL